MKKRIYEIAKEFDVKSKEIIQYLQEQGFDKIKVAANVITDVEIKCLEKKFSRTSVATTAPKPAKPTTSKPSVSKVKKSEKKPKSEPVAPVKKAPVATKPSSKPVAKTPQKPADQTPSPSSNNSKRPAPATQPAAPAKKPAFVFRGDQNRDRRRKKGKAIHKRRQRRDAHEQQRAQEALEREADLKTIRLPEAMTVKDLSQVTKISVNDIIKKLFMLGVVATINQRVERETLQMICDEYELEVEFVDDSTSFNLDGNEYSEENLHPRHAIVTILGHVDHGKTTLLDYIRRTKVVDSESGGITQHIGAYTVELEGSEKITFLDTPGHEAFTAMRAHGANVTDLIILVVAADDGIMPQTLESIAHAQAAGVPIIVALNKIDKESANPEKVKQMLAAKNLNPEEWGGSTIYVEISALKGTNVDTLLEMIALQAEMLELKAPRDCFAKGVVIESRLDKGRGIVSTVLIQSGTLKTGDNVIAGMTSGRIKVIQDQFGKKIDTVGPAYAAEILGLTETPQGGDKLYSVESTKFARQVANLRQLKVREQRMARESRVRLESVFDMFSENKVKELNIVLKADTQGSLLALKDSFDKLTDEEVTVKVIYSAVGGIRESDVMLATVSNAVIIGFHVRPDKQSTEMAKLENIDILCFKIIYEAIDAIKSALNGMYAPVYKEEIVGKALVKEVFKIPKSGAVAGCYIDEGKIVKGGRIRIVRDGIDVYEGDIASLRHFKDTVKEVKKGFECGVCIEGFSDFKSGDTFEIFKMVETERTPS